MSEKPASVTSSIEDAVRELLSMTNAAVKKLTESTKEENGAAEHQQCDDENLIQYQADKRLLEMLSDTQESHSSGEREEDDELHKEVSNQSVTSDPVKKLEDGKIVDVTTVLEEEPRSEISILDVGGGQPDTISSISTPSTDSLENTHSSLEGKKMMNNQGSSSSNSQSLEILKSTTGTLPGDSILSPISFPPGDQSSHLDDGDLQLEDSGFIPKADNGKEHKTLTSSVKSISDPSSPQNSTGNSSTASEVLKQSTRAPEIPNSARLRQSTSQQSKLVETIEVPDETGLSTVKQDEEKWNQNGQPKTRFIIRKSNHTPSEPIPKPTQQTTRIPHPSKQKVRIPKKKLREVKSPAYASGNGEKQLGISDERKRIIPPRTTLAQGEEVGKESDKENKEHNSSLKIIKSDKDIAKKKLLEAKGPGLINHTKRVVTANIIEGKTRSKQSEENGVVSTASAIAAAMASATPMLQVKHDLESQVKRLTEKLDELEKQKQQQETSRQQDRADDLERKLEQLTAQRLRSLEQLQEQQAAWQTHFLRVIGSIQNSQDKLSSAAIEKRNFLQAGGRNVRFNGLQESPNVLQTPAPRTQAPLPIDTKKTAKGMSPGNGYLLKNILEQMDVSTPGPSPAIPDRMKSLRDPLADLTPVRGPTEKLREKISRDGTTNGVNMTSTPQVEQETRVAVLKARKEAEKEAERLEILRKFPNSLSVYMIQDPGMPSEVSAPALQKAGPSTNTKPQQADDMWKVLEDLQTKRKYLDENLEAVERGRGGENIAAKVDFEIMSKNPKSDPALVEKLRIRKMVDEQIKGLETQIKEEVVKVQSRTNLGRGRGGRLPKAKPGARVDTGLRKKQPFQPKGKFVKSTKSSLKPVRARSSSPRTHFNTDETVCPDDEEFVTHVYGRADYHPRRSTVHNPYIHVNTPVKQPTFRKKQAVEVVKANLIRSAKTQTSPGASQQQSQYYFSPSASPVNPPISVSPTPGQLIPMAIPLGAPKMSDGHEPAPLLIHQTDPRYVTLTTGSPVPKRTIRVYNPATDGLRKPNTAVISVRGEDGPDLSVRKLDNIDIDTPDVSEANLPPAMTMIHQPEGLPGSSVLSRHDQDESEGTDGSLHIELRGGSEAQVEYHGPTFPPVAPPDPRHLNASDIADEIDKHEIEAETVRWVEQEILARILSELYPPGSQKIQDAGPVEDRDSDQPVGDQSSVLLNPESLQLFIDAGLPIDEATVGRLVEEELVKILREMIRRPAHDQSTRPKTPISQPAPAPRVHTYQVPTPLPTPEPSPVTSVSERPIGHLHTPSLTPESSMAESLPPREPSPVSSPEPRPPTPKAESPPKTPEEITLVQTPEATPPSTPTPEPVLPSTPISERTKTPVPVTPPLEFPDPWGGTQFPLPEEIGANLRQGKPTTFAPPPDPIDLVVRTVTPPPSTPPDRSLSEPDSTTTSSDRGESSISEGQLVISHGEMKPKMKRGHLPEIIEELFGDEDVERSMKFQSTLRDVNDLQDYEPYSDGEVRLNMRPAMIARVAGHDKPDRRPYPRDSPPGDDPAGPYTRPRHPLPSESEGDDLSVGEVKPRTIESRRDKFRKWRQERSPIYSHSLSTKEKKSSAKPKQQDESILPGSPLSMEDLHKRDQSIESSEPDSDRSSRVSEPEENFGGNVIVVTPASSKKKLPEQPKKILPRQPGAVKPSGRPVFQKPISTFTSEDFENIAPSTDQSAVIKDSLEESMRKRNGFEGFFDEKKEHLSPQHAALKVSLTLPSVEPVVSMSSEPISDVSEISGAGF
ncbi:uncharacterized protein LOC120326220 isoform X3 [Styela clava]